MKKFLLILFILFTWNVVYPQVLRTNSLYTKVVSGGGGYCAEYQAVYDAYATPPDATEAGYQNTMVSDLVDAGYWARMDVFYVFANDDGTDALLNWVNPGVTFTASNVHSTAFTAWSGFKGDGSNDYINLNFNPNDDKINSSLNSVALGVYIQHDETNNRAAIGATNGSEELVIYPDYGGSWSSRLNTGGGFGVANTDATGFYISTRRSSTNTEGYRNGNSIVEKVDNSSFGIPDALMSILALTTSELSECEVSIAFVMNAVSDAEAAEITTIIETYMDAIGTGKIP